MHPSFHLPSRWHAPNKKYPAHAQHNRDVQSQAPTKVKHQTSVLLRLLKVSKGFDPKEKVSKRTSSNDKLFLITL